jgi:hypothetical protein
MFQVRFSSYKRERDCQLGCSDFCFCLKTEKTEAEMDSNINYRIHRKSIFRFSTSMGAFNFFFSKTVNSAFKDFVEQIK